MGDNLHTFSFSKGFKKARKEVGYTQESFATALDISIETVKNWEQGRNIPEISTIKKLCAFFKCDIDYLFDNLNCKKHDDQFIQNETGLSETAINTLKSVNKHYNSDLINILNFIMNDTDTFEEFLANLTIYLSNKYTIPLYFDKEKRKYIDTSYTTANGESGMMFGYTIKDNKGNDGYEIKGTTTSIMESHAMLQIQEIMIKWKNRKKLSAK